MVFYTGGDKLLEVVAAGCRGSTQRQRLTKGLESLAVNKVHNQMLKAEMCPLTHTHKVCGHRSEWSRPQTAPGLAGSP